MKSKYFTILLVGLMVLGLVGTGWGGEGEDSSRERVEGVPVVEGGSLSGVEFTGLGVPAPFFVRPTEIPRTINVQGRVLDAAGAPRSNAEIQAAFAISTAPNGSAPFWNEGPFDIRTDANGVFNTILGTISPLPDLDGGDYYLFITDGSDVLIPGQKLVSVPMAISARNVRGGTVDAKNTLATNYSAALLASATNNGAELENYGGRFYAEGGKGRAVFGYAPKSGGGIQNFGGYFLASGGEGIGVLGSGNIGIKGYGLAAGGSFESTAGRGLSAFSHGSDRFSSGIWAEATDSLDGTENYGGVFYAHGGKGRGVVGDAKNEGITARNYGGRFFARGGAGRAVYGEAVKDGVGIENYGGYFIARGNSGYGVYAKGDAAGGKFESGGNGAALEIGAGKIKVSTPPMIVANYMWQDINGATGRVQFTSETGWHADIRNNYVNANSMIFLSVKYSYTPYRSEIIIPYVTSLLNNGTFRIGINRNVPTGENIVVNFLVIN
ncbi:hypothetical protein COT42_06340 [Candidatus Saganbacteria bacterium CG08_land_8_20_14_0_20_45_16]|uniref:Uncharacterized protein n=1 Tax=Candidatus Saganbacteria bacterium CG08_land_8_20_14_0_20_45_16 TaxID=2014293 RepID=A0A2H0XWC4_UNCSA|nr:MAG: hypothetical protein COT42_06340 [Candidatus Saganbacteria bacterium CG08_land_8_20_14_0_20_45_16]